MSLFDRLSGQLGALWDDVRLPERLDQSIALAENAIQEGRGAQALSLLDSVESERPGLWRVALVRGLAFESIGQYQRAAGSLTLAAEKRDVPLVRLALGRVAEGLDDLRSARDHYEQALEQRPNEPERLEVLSALAGVFERLGRPAAAIPALRHLLRASPDDASLMLRLAHALQDDGEVLAALDALEPAIALDPPPSAALLLAGRLHLRAEEFAQAQLRFTRVLHTDPNNAAALEGSGDVARRQGSVANALPLYHQALVTAPVDHHARLHYRVAQCFAATDDASRALDALRASVALDSSDRERLAFGASLALQVGELDEAIELAQRAIAGNDDDRALRALVGRVHLARGEVDEARQRLSTLRASRMTVDELHAIGELSLRVGDPIEAIALLREASVREPGRLGLDALLEEAAASLAPALPPLTGTASPTALAPFLDALSEAVAAHPLLADLIPRATALRQHLDTPLTVAVLGEFNAGKSTVINAFVGEDMVAMGVLPTTSHVNVIRYGPRKVARWTHHDGSVDELPYSEAASIVKREPESIASLEFCYPHPDLRRVHFWDTPGFNAPDDAHEFRAQQALERADAVVWMLDANQALTWSEYERLQVINDRSEKLLVVVNKIDRLGDDQEARAEIEAHIRDGLQDEMIGLFFLSARDALAARKAAPDEPPPESTGWPALEATMENRVFDRAGRLKALEVQRGLGVLLSEGIERASASIDRVRASAAALREQRTALQARAARWRVDVVERGHDGAVTALREVRLRGVRDVLQLATPQPGLFSRQRLVDDDVALLRDQIVERARAAWQASLAPVIDACNEIDDALVRTVEETASGLPTTDARAVRRRLEGWLTETSALRRLLVERGVAQPMSLVTARVDEFGGDLLRRLGSDPGRTEAERESLMHRLIPTPGASYAAMLDEWGAEYLSAARRLSDHVERDLDILTLDVEQRITRPFQAVLSALHAPPTEVE